LDSSLSISFALVKLADTNQSLPSRLSIVADYQAFSHCISIATHPSTSTHPRKGAL
jgi:hypothetical protein